MNRGGRREDIFPDRHAHIRPAMNPDRLTPRSKNKVDVQGKLFIIVHNLKKIYRYGI
jgi:hypothetical protein